MNAPENYKINIQDAVSHISSTNRKASFLASDYLMHKHFPDLDTSLDPETMVVRVVLLDGIWATQLSREPKEHLPPGQTAWDRIADNLCAHAYEMKKTLSELKPNDLRDCPNNFCEAAQGLLRVFFDDSKQVNGFRQNYSFATKFLHWCTRVHFPIIDSRSRAAIYYHNWAGVPKSPSKPYERDYVKWIHLYSTILRNLTDKDRDLLQKADQESQSSSPFAIKNSLLRILDKVFYEEGPKG